MTTQKGSKTPKTAATKIDPKVVRQALSTAKPSTCGEMWTVLRTVVDEAAATALGMAVEDCKRLPRHKGDHSVAKPRGLMTAAEKARTARKSKTVRKSRRVTKVDLADLASKVENGEMSASDALSLVAASQRRPVKRSKTANVTPKAAAAPQQIVTFCKARSKNGVEGKVMKIVGDRAVLRMKDGSDRTYLLTSLTRIAASQQAAIAN